MKHGTAYIRPEDRSLLNRLRLNEYNRSEGFTIKDAAVLWNKSDDESHVLGVWKRDELISSMRLEVIKTKKILEQKIETEVPAELLAKHTLNFPVGILSKAVTSVLYRGAGLNAHLRYHLLKVAAENGIEHIFGTLVKGAPRSNSLKDMGYEFYKHPTGWNSPFYKSTSEVEVVYLNLGLHRKTVLQSCARIAADSLLIYPWMGANERGPSL
jgi:hypothetical protein